MTDTSWQEYESLPPETKEREVFNLLKSIQKDTREIKAHVQITNGRVSKLEDRESFYKGALAIITVILLPIAFMVLRKYI